MATSNRPAKRGRRVSGVGAMGLGFDGTHRYASHGFGFATELGRAAYAAAAAVDSTVPFIAWIDEHNVPSRKVAERLGLINYGRATDPSDGRVRLAYADRPINASTG